MKIVIVSAQTVDNWQDVADAYFSKPSNHAGIVACLERLLGHNTRLPKT
jgi:hypothetical protein